MLVKKAPKAAIYGSLIVLSLGAQQSGTSNQLAEKPRNMTRAVGCVLSTEDQSRMRGTFPPMFLRPDPRVDDRYTTAPLSVWKQMIGDAINNHLPIQGMTKSEAAAAFVLGDYDLTTCSIVRYEEDFLTPHCLKYDGDNCIAYEHRKGHLDLSFTKAGYLLDVSNIPNAYLGGFFADRELNARMDSRKKILDRMDSLLRNSKSLELTHFCERYPTIFGMGVINAIGQKGPRCW
jgi:hypothetical protein